MNYYEQHHQDYLEGLKAFLRIPSVSTLAEHKPDIQRAAGFVRDELAKAGLANAQLIEGGGNPLVYAEWLGAPGKPTVLLYGHYDVQPPDPLEEWVTPPFEPAIRNDNIYARGSADDKGQTYILIKAVEGLLKQNGRLPINVKFLIEGEEEVGGVSVAKYVAENAEKLKADVALISDSSMYEPGMPTLDIGLRGLIYMEIESQGPSRDLHSGLYGGAAPNAVFGLIEFLAKVKNSKGQIKVPGFYDDVEPPAPAEKESWSKLPFNEKKFLKDEVGSTKLTGEPGFTVLERTWARPTFEVHGIGGGFTGAGSKTVIPAKAVAKCSFRLVPRQDPDKIIESFRAFIRKNTPKGIQLELRVLGASPGLTVNPEHPAIRVAAQAFSDIFNAPTVFTRSGGSIPIVGDFNTHLHIPTILMGFGLPDDGLHSPNEKYNIENYYKGIMTVAHFLEEYGRAS